MQDYIVGESFELTDAIKNNVEKSLKKIRKYIKEETQISVFLDKTAPYEFSVRFKLHHSHQDFVAEDRHKDFYAALHMARDHMVRQIKEHDEKVRKLARDPANKEELNASLIEQPEPAAGQ